MRTFLTVIRNIIVIALICAFVLVSASSFVTFDKIHTVSNTNESVSAGQETTEAQQIANENINNVVEQTAEPEVVEEPANIFKLSGENGEIVEISFENNIIVVEDDAQAKVLVLNKEDIPEEIILVAVENISNECISELISEYGLDRVNFVAAVSGFEFNNETTELSICDFDEVTAENVAAVLSVSPAITYVNLTDENGNACIELEQLGQLQQEYPDVVYDYPLALFGQTFSTADETLEYVKVQIGDAGLDSFREILPYMTQLTYLKLDSCNTSSEEMAKLRDENPDIKVVWRVFFSYDLEPYNCLTDTEKIWATGTVTDGFTHDLMYCTDVKYLDMGHNCITHINFINYMPKLEVAVLSISWIRDISPLANCPNLEFLEIYSSEFYDVSPLANCTNLKHLNLGNDSKITDISSLYDLDLERFYFNNNNVPQYQLDKYRELHPDCECSFGIGHPVHGTWRFTPDYRGEWDAPEAANYYNEEYLRLREIIGYDTWDYSR